MRTMLSTDFLRAHKNSNQLLKNVFACAACGSPIVCRLQWQPARWIVWPVAPEWCTCMWLCWATKTMRQGPCACGLVCLGPHSMPGEAQCAARHWPCLALLHPYLLVSHVNITCTPPTPHPALCQLPVASSSALAPSPCCMLLCLVWPILLLAGV